MYAGIHFNRGRAGITGRLSRLSIVFFFARLSAPAHDDP